MFVDFCLQIHRITKYVTVNLCPENTQDLQPVFLDKIHRSA